MVAARKAVLVLTLTQMVLSQFVACMPSRRSGEPSATTTAERVPPTTPTPQPTEEPETPEPETPEPPPTEPPEGRAPGGGVPPGRTGPLVPAAPGRTRPPTPEELILEQRKEQVLSTLWKSTLGCNLKSYLFDAPEEEVAQQADELVSRVFSELGSSLTYLSGLHLMIEDLYQSGQIGQEQQNRILLLQNRLAQKKIDTETYPSQGLANYAIIALVATLPLGSPQVRNALAYYTKQMAKMVERRFPWTEATRFFPSAIPPTGRDFRLGRLIAEFEPTYSIRKFFEYFGPFTLIYFYWYDWRESKKGHNIDEQTLERVNDQRRFVEFLRQLSNL